MEWWHHIAPYTAEMRLRMPLKQKEIKKVSFRNLTYIFSE